MQADTFAKSKKESVKLSGLILTYGYFVQPLSTNGYPVSVIRKGDACDFPEKFIVWKVSSKIYADTLMTSISLSLLSRNFSSFGSSLSLLSAMTIKIWPARINKAQISRFLLRWVIFQQIFPDYLTNETVFPMIDNYSAGV